MFVFSLVFLSTVFVCLKVFELGTISFVIGNIVNLLLRIYFSVLYAKEFFGIDNSGNFKWNFFMCLPRPIIFLGFVASFLITRISLLLCDDSLKGCLIHVGIGVSLAIGMLLIIWTFEDDLVKCVNELRSQKIDNKKD